MTYDKYVMDFKQWLDEMAIRRMQKVGQWGQETAPPGPKRVKLGYYGDDYGILTNQNALEKIKAKWAKSEQLFDIYFLRSKEGAKVREEGEVQPEFVHTRLNVPDYQPASDAINVIFTNNMGAERMPMNWWTMAHRFGHAVKNIEAFRYFTRELDSEIYRILEYYWGHRRQPSYLMGAGDGSAQLLSALDSVLGTMRSARDRLLRNHFEFYYELMAQFIIEGKVRFNSRLPRMLPTRFVYGRAEGKYMKHDLDEEDMEGLEDWVNDTLTPEVNNNLGVVLSQAVGRTFVM